MPLLRDLQQLRYWEGQTLRSGDFRDKGSMDAQRRWWHNRAIHAQFGVRYGLVVFHSTVGGLLNVSIGCGLAYDCFGRELILQRTRTAPPVPAGPGALLLLLGYRPLHSTCQAPEGTGVCLPAPDALLEDDLQLVWKVQSEVRIGDGIPLARVTFAQLTQVFDTAYRAPFARPIARPRLATGDTVHGNTPWEAWTEPIPAADGSFVAETVGVQTHVDTSASGFTATPNYFATLQWPKLTPGNESFATAYFPSIADATENGFTYRLLMKGIARRRLQPAFGVSEALASQQANLNTAMLNQVSAFRAGDQIARVVPRSQTVVKVDDAVAAILTLHAPLPALSADDVLAVGNPPRTSIVTNTPKGGDTAMQVTIAPDASVQAGDLLVRSTAPIVPGSIAEVTDVKLNTVTLDTPVTTLVLNDLVGFARPSLTFAIDTVAVQAGVMTVTLQDAPTFLAKEIAVRTTSGATPAAAKIDTVVGKVLTLASPIDGLTNTDVLSRVPQTFAVSGIDSKKRAEQFNVDHPGRFRPGDFIARLDNGAAASLPVRIDSINGRTIFLADTIDHLEKGNTIGAANVRGTYRAGVVQSGQTMQVTVATPEGFAAGDLVSATSGATPPVLIDGVKDGVLTLRSPIAGLTAGDLLVTARFPQTTTVVAVFPFGSFTWVIVDVGSALRTGDLVARLSDLTGTTAAANLATVAVTVKGGALNFVQLIGPVSDLHPGDILAPIGFGPRAIVHTAPTVAAPSTLTLDRTLDFREDDIIGPLAAYIETSRPQSILGIASNVLTLSGAIDGLAEGDIVGPASLTAELNHLRVENTDNLQRGDELQVTGLETNLLLPSSGPMSIADIDFARSVLTLTPSGSLAGISLRPETLKVAAVFNPNFVSSFALFAQQQNLYLCWLGCQAELQDPALCPGEVPDPDPCGGS